MRSLAFFLLLASPLGCAPTTAVVDGKTVPRLEMEYGGQPFAIRLIGAHPRPGGASSGLRDSGGRIVGNVCGLDVNFDVEHQGDHVHLTGTVDEGGFEASLTVSDERNVTRVIKGWLSSTGGSVSVELGTNRIAGNVGVREFELGREGDHYVGVLRIGQSVKALARINGAEQLWELPAAAQALVLPALMTCNGEELEEHMRGALIVGFGGEQTFEPKKVSSLYHSNTGDQKRIEMELQQSRNAMGGR
jgi:hypothetical protein